MNWLILMAAGLFEVVWATALKMSNGFANVKAEKFRPLAYDWMNKAYFSISPKVGTACRDGFALK